MRRLHDALEQYANRRDALCPRPQSSAFLLTERGRRVHGGTARRTFVAISCSIGLRPPMVGRRWGRGPRLQDFRHSFATKRLVEWYRAGLDVERELPKLSTYLGHVEIGLTYWYIEAVPELLARVNDSDSALRFWAVLGLVTSRSGDAEVVSGLKSALQDDSVSVRITAAEGLFNLGRHEEGLPVLIAALNHPIRHAQVRAAGVLDSQPPEATRRLRTAIAPLQRAVRRYRLDMQFGLNYPFKRALKAVTGEANTYRWGPGASGSPRQ